MKNFFLGALSVVVFFVAIVFFPSEFFGAIIFLIACWAVLTIVGVLRIIFGGGE